MTEQKKTQKGSGSNKKEGREVMGQNIGPMKSLSLDENHREKRGWKEKIKKKTRGAKQQEGIQGEKREGDAAEKKSKESSDTTNNVGPN